MFNSWHFKYALMMSGLFAITVGYNACSEDAGFNLIQGVDSIEEYNSEQSADDNAQPKPSVLINNDSEYTQEAVVNLSLNPDGLADQMLISNDSDCSSGQWEAYQQNKLWTLNRLNQDTSVFVKYKFQDDPETECVMDSIVHDDIPPNIQFTQGVGTLWISSSSISILYQVTDSGSGVREIQCDRSGSGNFQACGNNVSYSNLSENANYLLVVQAFDKAGNKADPQQLNWRPDYTAPTVTFNSTPAAITADITPDFSFSGTDLGSGIAFYECKVDAAAYTNCSSPTSLSGLADGPHTFSVRATDQVGLVSAPATYNWIQDTQAPTIAFTQTPNPIENSGNAAFAFQVVAGDLASYECRIDGGPYQVCTSPRNLMGLADGNHSFSVIGRDSAGNASGAITYNWLIDSTAPTIAFSETPSSVESSTSARFSFVAQDAGSGINRVDCRLDGGSFAPCQTTMTFNNLTANNHTLQARSLDNAGNYSAVISYNWMVDNVAPTVQITSTPANPTNQTSANFTFSATDNGSGISFSECRIDGAPYASCTSPAAFANLTDGQHNFSVRARDNAGNLSAVASYQWLVDTTPPTLNFVLRPNAVEYIGSTPRIQFIADDGNGSGVASFACLHNAQVYTCDQNLAYDFPAVAESNQAFQVTVTDNVGNSSSQTLTWQVRYQVVDKQVDVQIEGDRPVDILFVVDNSGSMNNERANLAQRIDGFIGKIDGLDWQLAVTSTDVSGSYDWENGRIVDFDGNGLHILTPALDPSLSQTLFGNKVQAYHRNSNPDGIREGSGAEQGIYATVKVLNRDLSGQPGDAANAEFIREGADLAVVVLSDEDENSSGSNVQYTPQQFLDFVNQSYQGTKTITWHSIVTMSGDQACKNAGYSYYGVNYEELSRLTGHGQPGGAIIGSVCANDYTSQLQDIGQSVQDMQKTFSLGCAPLDTDADGNPEMAVEYMPMGGSTYSAYSQSFTIQGQKIIFDDFLPPGNFRFNFQCNN